MLPLSLPPALFAGRTVAILATGESMTAAVADAVRVAGIGSVAVNDAYRLAPWAGVLYAADGAWWNVHGPRGAFAFEGWRVSATPMVRGPVMSLRVSGQRGFDDRLGYIRTGSNSGYQAVHLAAQLGARKIVLCGIDMRGSHFFGLHPSPLRNTGSFTRYIELFRTIAQPLANRGIDVVNVSPCSALDAFRRGVLEQELAGLPRAA